MYKNFENNNKQFKSKLVEHLNETLFIENESIDRITSRIVQTPIQEVEQKLTLHLEELKPKLCLKASKRSSCEVAMIRQD